jgi:hypothetical protein
MSYAALLSWLAGFGRGGGPSRMLSNIIGVMG